MRTFKEQATIYVAYSKTHDKKDAIYYVKYLLERSGVRDYTAGFVMGTEDGVFEDALRIEIIGDGLQMGTESRRSPIPGIVDSLKGTFDQKRVLVVFSHVHAHIV
jgi:hypothetical protein